MRKWLLNTAAETKGLVYIRVQRGDISKFMKKAPNLSWAKANILRDGKDVTLFTAGSR